MPLKSIVDHMLPLKPEQTKPWIYNDIYLYKSSNMWQPPKKMMIAKTYQNSHKLNFPIFFGITINTLDNES